MARQKKLLGVGLGAGLLGAMFVALKYAVRPATKTRVPDTISPAVFRTKVLHTSIGQIVYHECGSGQPLIFVHSICPGASSYEWSKVYPHFAATHHVLAPDLVGFGESARPDANLTAADYARSLAEFIRATCDFLEMPPVLIGSGLGAGFCVLLASQHPELVSRLILLMPTALTEFGQRQISLGTRLAGALPLLHRFLYRNYESTKTAIQAWLNTFGFSNPSAVNEETVNIYTTCARQYGAEHAIRNLHMGRLGFDLEDRMKTLTQPVTLLWSDSVPLLPFEWAQRLQAITPNCNIVTLGGAALLATVEFPDQVCAILQEQLSGELRVVKES